MPTETMDHPIQSIEKLSERYQQLSVQRVQAQRDLEHAQSSLNQLKAKAREDYGTDDIEDLKQILDDMKRKNEEDRANYQASLDAIESELNEIDKKYGST